VSDSAHKTAIALEMVREDRKWYENVEAVADAIREADRAAYVRGVNHGLTGQRDGAVPILDEYAPPVGPVAVCNEDTARESARVEIETPGLTFRGAVAVAGGSASGEHWYDRYARENPPVFCAGGYNHKLFLICPACGPKRDYFPSPSVPQPDGDCRFPEEAE